MPLAYDVTVSAKDLLAEDNHGGLHYIAASRILIFQAWRRDALR